MSNDTETLKRANLAKALEAARTRARTMSLGSRLPIQIETMEREPTGYNITLRRSDGYRERVFSEDVDAENPLEVAKWVKLAEKALDTGRKNTH